MWAQVKTFNRDSESKERSISMGALPIILWWAKSVKHLEIHGYFNKENSFTYHVRWKFSNSVKTVLINLKTSLKAEDEEFLF